MEEERFKSFLEDMNSKLDLFIEAQKVLLSEMREAREESTARHDRNALMLETLIQKL
jgi:hypothetical protein